MIRARILDTLRQQEDDRICAVGAGPTSSCRGFVGFYDNTIYLGATGLDPPTRKPPAAGCCLFASCGCWPMLFLLSPVLVHVISPSWPKV